MSALPESSSYAGSAQGYALGPVIGYGAFAVVYKAKVLSPSLHEDEEVAIKVVDLDSMEGTTFDDVRRELQIMRLSTHPNIISYHVAFPVESKMWLVMPLVNGGSCQAVLKELKKQKVSQGIRNTAILAFILKETAEALDHCHKNQTLHRDLKASNLLVANLATGAHIYLSDFGVSASMRDNTQRQTFTGTPSWMSPEQLNSLGYSYPADVWAFGVTAIELAIGAAPYQHLHPLKVMKCIIDSPPARLDDPSLVSPDFGGALTSENARVRELAGVGPGAASPGEGECLFDRDLVKLVADCLQKDPAKRPSFDQILNKYKSFFDKADGAQLKELLDCIPPLDAREQALARPAHANKKGASHDHLSGEWNFDLDEDESDDVPVAAVTTAAAAAAADFQGIGETEF